jgi:cold shock protein
MGCGFGAPHPLSARAAGCKQIKPKQTLDTSSLTQYFRPRLEAHADPELISGTSTVCVQLPFLVRAAGTVRRAKSMASGKVKWWNNKTGYGFITQDSGQDVFVHHSAVVGQGFKVLSEGEEVVFDVVASERGPKAENVQRARAS